jgi:uncharacterized cofD-like protein
LPTLLRGLRAFTGSQHGGVRVTAVVCVSDDGGSSGRLRRRFGIPAVGDLRNCLAALSPFRQALVDLFHYRLPRPRVVRGHPVGNLLVAAACAASSDFANAVRKISWLLRSRGRVLPVTQTPITLNAEHADGRVTRGESLIPQAGSPIRRIWLDPADPAPTPGVLPAIERADVIVLGPGSLFTSVLPNLLVPGVAAAICASRALRICVCNLVTEAGETDGFRASDHLRTVLDYLAPGAVDIVLVDPLRQQVETDTSRIEELGAKVLAADLASHQSHRLHDAGKLARQVLLLAHSFLVPAPATIVNIHQASASQACLRNEVLP